MSRLVTIGAKLLVGNQMYYIIRVVMIGDSGCPAKASRQMSWLQTDLPCLILSCRQAQGLHCQSNWAHAQYGGPFVVYYILIERQDRDGLLTPHEDIDVHLSCTRMPGYTNVSSGFALMGRLWGTNKVKIF